MLGLSRVFRVVLGRDWDASRIILRVAAGDAYLSAYRMSSCLSRPAGLGVRRAVVGRMGTPLARSAFGPFSGESFMTDDKGIRAL